MTGGERIRAAKILGHLRAAEAEPGDIVLPEFVHEPMRMMSPDGELVPVLAGREISPVTWVDEAQQFHETGTLQGIDDAIPSDIIGLAAQTAYRRGRDDQRERTLQALSQPSVYISGRRGGKTLTAELVRHVLRSCGITDTTRWPRPAEEDPEGTR